MNGTPKIRVEQPLMVLHVNFVKPTVEADPGVVDPCVEAAESLDRHIRHMNQFVPLSHVGGYEGYFAA